MGNLIEKDSLFMYDLYSAISPFRWMVSSCVWESEYTKWSYNDVQKNRQLCLKAKLPKSGPLTFVFG